MIHQQFPSDLPTFFADAEAGFSEADVVLFGICYDKTASFRPGSRYGPDEIRKASWNFEPYNFLTGHCLKDIKLHDYGNIVFEEKDSIKQVFQKVTACSQQALSHDKTPILLGGEHLFSAASIHAFKKDIQVIIFDAHLDFRSTYVDQQYNHACTIRRIHDHLPADQITIIGARSGSKKEYDELMKSGVHLFSSEEIHKRGIDDILLDIKKRIGENPLYLSIDIDVLDPIYAPGTGTLEPFGLSPTSITQTIDLFSHQLCGMDLMEVAPCYDNGQTAILAAKIIKDAIEKAFF